MGGVAPQGALLTLNDPPQQQQRAARPMPFINPPADGSLQFSVGIEAQVDRVFQAPSIFETTARREPVVKRSPPDKRRGRRSIEHQRNLAAQRSRERLSVHLNSSQNPGVKRRRGPGSSRRQSQHRVPVADNVVAGVALRVRLGEVGLDVDTVHGTRYNT